MLNLPIISDKDFIPYLGKKNAFFEKKIGTFDVTYRMQTTHHFFGFRNEELQKQYDVDTCNYCVRFWFKHPEGKFADTFIIFNRNTCSAEKCVSFLMDQNSPELTEWLIWNRLC